MQNKPMVVVLDSNPNSREILASYINEMDFIQEVKLYSDYNQGLEKIKSLEDDVIVILDISQGNSDEFIEKVRLHVSKLIITSTDYSTNMIVKALRMGAKEFLPKPVLKNDLFRVLKMFADENYSSEDSNSKVISVYSNKGGIGKTVIAVNLAKELAQVTKSKVALVDLNLQLGDVATFLNLNPIFDVSYVMKNFVDKNEDEFLKSFEQYKNSSLYVLSDPTYIEQAERISPQEIVSLFKAMKKVFTYIIVDMSSAIDENSLKILDCSDLIFFTTIVNIPAIRNAQRCLNLFKSRHYPNGKVKIIVNRYMNNEEIKIEDIENTLGEKVYWKIPNNYFTIMEAINKGVSISEVDSSSNIGNNFREFAMKVSDDIIEQAVIQYRM